MTAGVRVGNLTVQVGGARLLDDVSFDAEPGSITGIVGPNGAGKTTLLRRWTHGASLDDAAVIVHDFGDIGVDAELLADEDTPPVVGRLVGRVAALHGIHAREQLHSSVGRALDEIAALDPPAPLVLCESTGAARPWPLIEALTQDRRFFLRHFIVTVDALNLHRDFEDGRFLTGEAGLNDAALERAAEVLAEQILFASVLVLTKVDLLSKPVVEAQLRVLRALRPDTPIALSNDAGLLLHQLDAAAAPDVGELGSWAKRFGLNHQAPTPETMASVVLRDPRPFHPKRLFDVCQERLGTGVYRTKGFFWLPSRPSQVLLWQQSGSQIGLEIRGLWRAEVIRDVEEKLLPEEIARLNADLEAGHPVFGDRRNELTFIGDKHACETFRAAMAEALCTDDEVAAWQAGESFEDPWPQSVRPVQY